MIFFVILSPGVIASYIYNKNKENTDKFLDFIVWTFIFSLLIFTFILGLSYLRGHKLVLIADLFSTVSAVLKYAAISFMTAITLPNVITLLGKITLGKKK